MIFPFGRSVLATLLLIGAHSPAHAQVRLPVCAKRHATEPPPGPEPMMMTS